MLDFTPLDTVWTHFGGFVEYHSDFIRYLFAFDLPRQNFRAFFCLFYFQINRKPQDFTTSRQALAQQKR